MSEINHLASPWDRHPAAHISFVDSKSRHYFRELPPDLVRQIVPSIDNIETRPGQFFLDQLMDAMRMAMTLVEEDDWFEHPGWFEEKVLQHNALRLVIEGALDDFAMHGANMSPHEVSVILEDRRRAVLHALLAIEPL